MDLYAVIAIMFNILFSYIFFIRLSGWKVSRQTKIITGFIFTVIFSAILLIITVFISGAYRYVLIALFSSVFLSAVVKEKLDNTLINTYIAYAVSYILYIITLFLAVTIMVVFFNIESKNYGIALLTGAIEAVAVYFILKKIKIEFSMAQKRSFGGVALGLSGLVMILYSLLGKEDIPNRFFVAMLTGIILCALGVFYLVKRETSINFNSKVSARKIQKIEEKNRFLSETSSELETTLHREKKRLPAYQKALEEIIADCVCDDCKKKAARLLDEIRGAQSEAWLELPKEVRSDKYLPKTSIELFDALITHMFDIAAEKGIDFEFLTSGEIEEITDIITQTQLQTIAADLMQNAVLACGYSENSEKMMITELKKAGGLFELSVKDNGIPFKRETLELLGTCRATTHKEDGGTGIGFMAIFEILRAFSASLIIAENMENKKITVRFDGKGEYILYTNGVEKIKRSVLL